MLVLNNIGDQTIIINVMPNNNNNKVKEIELVELSRARFFQPAFRSVVEPPVVSNFHQKTFVIASTGYPAAGTSSIVDKYCRGRFNVFREASDAELSSKKLILNDTQVRLRIWDVSFRGDDLQKNISYVNNADVVLLTFNVRTCFEKQRNHFVKVINTIRDFRSKVPIYLVGSKIDLILNVEELENIIDSFVEENKLSGRYFCSAKTGDGLDHMFGDVLKKCGYRDDHLQTQTLC